MNASLPEELDETFNRRLVEFAPRGQRRDHRYDHTAMVFSRSVRAHEFFHNKVTAGIRNEYRSIFHFAGVEYNREDMDKFDKGPAKTPTRRPAGRGLWGSRPASRIRP